MRTVSLLEAKEHLDELVEEAVAGEEVSIALDEKLAIRLERLRRWEDLSAEEKKASLRVLLALLREMFALPALDRQSTERILAGGQTEGGGFRLKLEEKSMAVKSGVDQGPVVKTRVFGMDQGKLVIPEDFDAPMPEIEELFYGSDR
jgi:antitoxin (DNA-binding transcriptional repressor) of toxin-antitoxin stability system